MACVFAQTLTCFVISEQPLIKSSQWRQTHDDRAINWLRQRLCLHFYGPTVGSQVHSDILSASYWPGCLPLGSPALNECQRQTKATTLFFGRRPAVATSGEK